MPIKKILNIDTSPSKPVKIWTDDIDEKSMEQLRSLGSLPFIFKHVAVMPDVQAGKGSTIGSVIATQGAITPATVGVDLGCGMSAYKIPELTPELLETKLKDLRRNIESVIPVGFSCHKNEEGVKTLLPEEITGLKNGRDGVLDRARSLAEDNKILRGVEKLGQQAGTLGGGNHFIEVCVSKNGEVWLMLHSGSRGLGNLIAQYHIEVAKGLMKKAFIDLPSPDLAYFWEGSNEFDHYLKDMLWAQTFAYWNRRAMGRLALAAIYKTFGMNPQAGGGYEGLAKMPFIDCHHNYVAKEHHYGSDVWVTRKGAVRARQGDLGIIPGSMGARSFIVSGLGNAESFCSCSHGAGRKMSRTQAKKVFTVDDLKAQTSGVQCRKDNGVVDEIPGAYKDIDEVMANQSDLVEVREELRQLICIKG